jgi:phage FluMu protein Com
MKTQQTGSKTEPDEENTTLALIIKCPKCRTQRAFKFNDTLATVMTRESSGMEVSTFCEKCSRRIAIQFCWTKRWVPGWTVEKVVFREAVTVEDHFGLSPQEGEKII